MEREYSSGSSEAREEQDYASTHSSALDSEASGPTPSEVASAPEDDTAEAEVPSGPVNPKRKKSTNRRARKARSRSERLRGQLNPAFRDLLNSVIADVAKPGVDNVELLPPSQIGASCWSAKEKSRFFSTLASVGGYDLPALATAVKTKSAPEIRQYLLLLQQAVAEREATAEVRDLHDFAEVPAAWEVSVECEGQLDLAAEALAWHVEKHEAKLVQEKYGGFWVINEAIAARLEDEAAPLIHGPAEREKRSLDVATAVSIPSAWLLRPQAWLTLSSTLFMAIPLSNNEDWICDASVSTDTPAISRTAFDDFHNLAISLTRRLVQASIFEALSRLRAKQESHPQPLVRANDVRTAVDVLKLRTDWKTYWAGMARRCGLEVLTSGKKWLRSGREEKRGRVKLKYDEVEAELGMKQPLFIASDDARSSPDNEDSQIKDSEIPFENQLDDQNSSTEAGTEDDNISSVSSDVSSSPDEEDDDNAIRQHSNAKRAVSQQSLDRLEDHYLEALDIQASSAEEQRLWHLLKARPATQKRELGNEARQVLPERPTKRRRQKSEMLHWRESVDFLAEWETR